MRSNAIIDGNHLGKTKDSIRDIITYPILGMCSTLETDGKGVCRRLLKPSKIAGKAPSRLSRSSDVFKDEDGRRRTVSIQGHSDAILHLRTPVDYPDDTLREPLDRDGRVIHLCENKRQ